MKHLLTLLIVAVLASTSFAQAPLAQEGSAKKKKGGKITFPVKKTKRALKSLTLTSEQQATFDEAAEKLTAELAGLEQMGLTQEIRKARSEKQKAGRESGLKGAELKAHIMEGVPAEQVELLKKSDRKVTAFQKTVANMLTDEQLDALPKKAQKKMKSLAEGKGGSDKKKKDGKRKKKNKGEAAE